ncbi:MAG: tetratricopeptide repeat protein [Caulobacter sp.]|nr:tetratricopeptide repeat protein [Caulobacter sp.]
MSFRIALAAVTALAVLTVAAPAAAQSISRQIDFLKLEQQAAETVAALVVGDFQDCDARLPTLREIMADRRVDRMRTEVRRPFYFSVILCSEIKDRPLGLKAARLLEPLATEPMEIGAVQTIQISDAIERHAMAEATRRFLTLLDAQPAIVAAWRPALISAFTDYIDDDPDLTLTALARIAGTAWTRPETLRARDNEWALAYGWQLGDRGRVAEAAKALDRAQNPRTLLYAAADRRFAPLWDKPDRFDWRALAEADLARARAEMEISPADLEPVQDVLAILRALGRYDEAIQIGEAYRARLQDGEAFTDADSQGDGVLIQLGHALFDTGAVKESEAVFTEAINSRSGRYPSTDARMSWASRLLDLGRPREALTVLDGLDRDYVTDYGEAWIDSQRACAQADLDRKAAEALLTSLRKSRERNPGALSQALICMNRLDEAAALLIWRLQTPSHRAGALDPFWVSLPPPVVAPWQARFESRRQTLLARTDVRQALDAVGRAVAVPLSGDFWGGY